MGIPQDENVVPNGWKLIPTNAAATITCTNSNWKPMDIDQQVTFNAGCVPIERHGHTTCLYKNVLILFGGTPDGSSGLNDLFFMIPIKVSQRSARARLENTDLERTTAKGRSAIRSLLTLGVQRRQEDDSVIAFGGSNDKRKDNKVYILDIDTLEWSQPPTSGVCPSPRQLHTAVAIGESMIVFGGWGKHQELNDLYILNTRTMRWVSPKIESAISPCCRQLHSAWVYNGKMYILGGYSKSKRMNDVYSFTPEQTVSSLRDLCVEKIVEDISSYIDYFRYLPEELLYVIYSRLSQAGKTIPIQLDQMIKESYLAEYALMNASNNNNIGTIEETLSYN
ncbi:Kelch repeat-containing protein [Heterostelium album PN500]|uniref:Kelch repeat-containing protein n=1 Tax=Heterostelium pallidum (strain ATCC 26659 / Pp 5 / PN500) TaxID=670386 RepID=D3B542_HETP5|nr:Kelch repeat-containing protein [Heterostelium album PN500]EFA83407.1 Kelch repeat-containing protein [Heterostelium album PN500]|eukprot:XP_020435524.1 Kelch repeat-containing protein [Heterostelium album PN500]